MNLSRRSFLKALGALPVIGPLLVEEPELVVPTKAVFPAPVLEGVPTKVLYWGDSGSTLAEFQAFYEATGPAHLRPPQDVIDEILRNSEGIEWLS